MTSDAAQSETAKTKVNQCINRTTRSTDEKTVMSALRVSLVSLLGRVVCCISSVTWAIYSPTLRHV